MQGTDDTASICQYRMLPINSIAHCLRLRLRLKYLSTDHQTDASPAWRTDSWTASSSGPSSTARSKVASPACPAEARRLVSYFDNSPELGVMPEVLGWPVPCFASHGNCSDCHAVLQGARWMKARMRFKMKVCPHTYIDLYSTRCVSHDKVAAHAAKWPQGLHRTAHDAANAGMDVPGLLEGLQLACSLQRSDGGAPVSCIAHPTCHLPPKVVVWSKSYIWFLSNIQFGLQTNVTSPLRIGEVHLLNGLTSVSDLPPITSAIPLVREYEATSECSACGLAVADIGLVRICPGNRIPKQGARVHQPCVLNVPSLHFSSSVSARFRCRAPITYYMPPHVPAASQTSSRRSLSSLPSSVWFRGAGETLADLRRSPPTDHAKLCIVDVELNHGVEFQELPEEPIALSDASNPKRAGSNSP
ncbi:hypothetical protein CPLU01_07522 [Colletotrichum plurivorum]|uniref:Uncharacterized protein n=1 Tax=Colletotrichum plurivorum TaxID=2175906 RepID=A0A8H6KER3_9PEZI|nr:hypothetical protein CPLU01_07522 [Colletotrichum plurivorum]